ncbi:MAG: hypothetical protein IJP76_08625 [Paludibacteraceae bacterium]|nr:hypothetical protein [Paludibacteraceae bacterium]
MKKFSFLALAALSLTGCWTSIFTVAPTVEPVAPPKTVYTTQVTTPAPKTTTVTTVTVTSYNGDMSFYLDLNAVAAAFAEARNIQEFEQLLNSSKYMINNLDLNRDGWIDYLRVIETYRSGYHALLIQACLAPSVFQDVATLIAERRPDALYVEVVGDRWLYGYNYVVRPVFIKRPPMWELYGHAGYVVWVSPYYYGYFPSYYTRPKPVYLNHYQAYVNTYMSNHHYCHHCDYPSQPFYTGYTDMTKPHSRNDYSQAHQNESFERRVSTAQATTTGGVSVRNAGQLRNEVNRQAAKEKESSSSVSARSTSSTSSSATSTTTGGTSARSTQTSQSSPSRDTSSSKTTTSSSTSSTSSSTRSTSSTQKPSTTVESRVSKSGTTRTTVKTTDASGRTTTVKRESAKPAQSAQPARTSTQSSSSTRSSGSSSSSATSTTTGGTSTRSGGSTRR